MLPTCPPIASRRLGCSLIDTVVLTLLLAILASLVLPGIRLALDEHAKVNCVNNLREIGSAYHGLLNAHKDDKRFSIGSGWRKQLKDYLNQTGLPAETQKKLDTDGSIFSCLYVEPPEANLLPGASILARSYGPGDRYEQIQIPLSLESAGMRVSSNYVGIVLELAVPSGGQYRNWGQLVVAVNPQTDGSTKLRAISTITSPYSFDLYDSYGQLLVYDFSPSSENSFTFFPGIAPSYGMNPAAQRFQVEDDGNKVLIAEYKKAVCSVVDLKIDWPPPRRQVHATDSWPNDCAPRHNGMLNVLFVDGSVKSLSPRDIDPRQPALAKQYWLPTAHVPGD